MNIRLGFLLQTPAILVLASCGGNPGSQSAVMPVDPCSGAWVRLYDDAGLSGDRLTIAYPTDQSSLAAARVDTGARNLNDRVTSAQWSISEGCKLVLYEHENFQGTAYPFVGSGRTEQEADIRDFSDRASAARWERSQ